MATDTPNDEQQFLRTVLSLVPTDDLTGILHFVNAQQYDLLEDLQVDLTEKCQPTQDSRSSQSADPPDSMSYSGHVRNASSQALGNNLSCHSPCSRLHAISGSDMGQSSIATSQHGSFLQLGSQFPPRDEQERPWQQPSRIMTPRATGTGTRPADTTMACRGLSQEQKQKEYANMRSQDRAVAEEQVTQRLPPMDIVQQSTRPSFPSESGLASASLFETTTHHDPLHSASSQQQLVSGQRSLARSGPREIPLPNMQQQFCSRRQEDHQRCSPPNALAQWLSDSRDPPEVADVYRHSASTDAEAGFQEESALADSPSPHHLPLSVASPSMASMPVSQGVTKDSSHQVPHPVPRSFCRQESQTSQRPMSLCFLQDKLMASSERPVRRRENSFSSTSEYSPRSCKSTQFSFPAGPSLTSLLESSAVLTPPQRGEGALNQRDVQHDQAPLSLEAISRNEVATMQSASAVRLTDAASLTLPMPCPTATPVCRQVPVPKNPQAEQSRLEFAQWLGDANAVEGQRALPGAMPSEGSMQHPCLCANEMACSQDASSKTAQAVNGQASYLPTQGQPAFASSMVYVQSGERGQSQDMPQEVQQGAQEPDGFPIAPGEEEQRVADRQLAADVPSAHPSDISDEGWESAEPMALDVATPGSEPDMAPPRHAIHQTFEQVLEQRSRRPQDVVVNKDLYFQPRSGKFKEQHNMAVVDLNPLCELFNGHSQEGCELRLVWRERDSEQEPIRTDEGQVLVQFETRGRHQRFAVSIERPQKDGVDELFDILFIQCKCGKLLVRLDGEFRWFRPPRQRRPRKGSQRLDSGKRQNRKMNSHSRRPYQSRNRPGAKPLFDGNGTILLARAVSTGLCEVVYVYEPGSPDEHTNPLCPSCTMPILQRNKHVIEPADEYELAAQFADLSGESGDDDINQALTAYYRQNYSEHLRGSSESELAGLLCLEWVPKSKPLVVFADGRAKFSASAAKCCLTEDHVLAQNEASRCLPWPECRQAGKRMRESEPAADCLLEYYLSVCDASPILAFLSNWKGPVVVVTVLSASKASSRKLLNDLCRCQDEADSFNPMAEDCLSEDESCEEGTSLNLSFQTTPQHLTLQLTVSGLSMLEKGMPSTCSDIVLAAVSLSNLVVVEAKRSHEEAQHWLADVLHPNMEKVRPLRLQQQQTQLFSGHLAVISTNSTQGCDSDHVHSSKMCREHSCHLICPELQHFVSGISCHLSSTTLSPLTDHGSFTNGKDAHHHLATSLTIAGNAFSADKCTSTISFSLVQEVLSNLSARIAEDASLATSATRSDAESIDNRKPLLLLATLICRGHSLARHVEVLRAILSSAIDQSSQPWQELGPDDMLAKVRAQLAACIQACRQELLTIVRASTEDVRLQQACLMLIDLRCAATNWKLCGETKSSSHCPGLRRGKCRKTKCNSLCLLPADHFQACDCLSNHTDSSLACQTPCWLCEFNEVPEPKLCHKAAGHKSEGRHRCEDHDGMPYLVLPMSHVEGILQANGTEEDNLTVPVVCEPSECLHLPLLPKSLSLSVAAEDDLVHLEDNMPGAANFPAMEAHQMMYSLGTLRAREAAGREDESDSDDEGACLPARVQRQKRKNSVSDVSGKGDGDFDEIDVGQMSDQEQDRDTYRRWPVEPLPDMVQQVSKSMAELFLSPVFSQFQSLVDDDEGVVVDACNVSENLVEMDKSELVTKIEHHSFSTARDNVNKLMAKSAPKPILLSRIFAPKTSESGRRLPVSKVLVVAGAGIGKTAIFKHKTPTEFGRENIWQWLGLLFPFELRDSNVSTASDWSSLIRLLVKMPEEYVDAVVAFIRTSPSRVALILDGLDECSLEKCSDFMRNLLLSPPENLHVIVTSRPCEDASTLKSRATYQRFVEVQGFSDRQIDKFVRENLGSTEDADQLLTLVRRSPEIKALMCTPVFAVLLCELQATQKTPHCSTSLFEGFIQIRADRLRRALASRTPPDVEHLVETAIHRLQFLAYHMLSAKRILFDQSDLDELGITEEDMQLGLLRNCPTTAGAATSQWRFNHLMVQEFLAARHAAKIIRCSSMTIQQLVYQLGVDHGHLLTFWKFLIALLSKEEANAGLMAMVMPEHMAAGERRERAKLLTHSTEGILNSAEEPMLLDSLLEEKHTCEEGQRDSANYHQTMLMPDDSQLKNAAYPSLTFPVGTILKLGTDEEAMDTTDQTPDEVEPCCRAVGRDLVLLACRCFHEHLLYKRAHGNCIPYNMPAIFHLLRNCHLDMPITQPSLLDFRAMSSAMQKHPEALHKVDLSLCGMTDQGFQQLLPGLQRCTQLVEVHISDNSLTSRYLPELSECLQRNQVTLQCFSAARNPIGNKGLEILKPGLQGCTQLQGLWLNGTGIDEASAANLCEILCFMSSLHTLWINSNDLGAKTLSRMQSELMQLTSLKVLNFSSMSLSSDALPLLSHLLQANPDIETLNLAERNLFDRVRPEEASQFASAVRSSKLARLTMPARGNLTKALYETLCSVRRRASGREVLFYGGMS